MLFNEFEQMTTADLLFHLTRQNDSLTTVSIFFKKRVTAYFIEGKFYFYFP